MLYTICISLIILISFIAELMYISTSSFFSCISLPRSPTALIWARSSSILACVLVNKNCYDTWFSAPWFNTFSFWDSRSSCIWRKLCASIFFWAIMFDLTVRLDLFRISMRLNLWSTFSNVLCYGSISYIRIFSAMISLISCLLWFSIFSASYSSDYILSCWSSSLSNSEFYFIWSSRLSGSSRRASDESGLVADFENKELRMKLS